MPMTFELNFSTPNIQRRKRTLREFKIASGQISDSTGTQIQACPTTEPIDFSPHQDSEHPAM